MRPEGDLAVAGSWFARGDEAAAAAWRPSAEQFIESSGACLTLGQSLVPSSLVEVDGVIACVDRKSVV